MTGTNRKRMTYEQQRAAREGRTRTRSARSSQSTTRQNSSRLSNDTRRSSTPSRSFADATSTSRSTGATRSTRAGASSRASGTTAGRYSRTSGDTSARRTSNTRSTSRYTRRSLNSDSTAARKPLPLMKIGIVVVLLVLVVGAVQLCNAVSPVTVTVNGAQVTIRGDKTLEVAARESGLPINPGDLISLKGNVLKKNEGYPLTAYVNGEKTADPTLRLKDGDVIDLSDGEDMVEEYDEVTEPIPYSTTIAGVGAVHVYSETGSEGTLSIRTGKISGETIEKQTVDPVNAVFQRYNIDTGGDKVIALTFDDGPSGKYTDEILDILAENDAKATFFVVGEMLEENNGDQLVKRAYDEGHQICTHTYDHAKKSPTLSLTDLSPEEQIAEIEQGRQVIADATGAEASYVVRFPGGDYNEELLATLLPYIDAEMGWNVDTGDWAEPGAAAIEEVLLSAEGGDIVLMHDGGGDRSQTVEALRSALPKLKQQGYTFITVDEMMAYPAAARY